MPNKELWLQFFHERAYVPQPLEDFEREATLAKRLGAKMVFIGEIPKDSRDWSAHPNDPYPNWGMLLTNLFKLVVPGALSNYLDGERARRNLSLLKARAQVLEKLGLRAALQLSEPFYLPESAYRDHPAWRGPRCDHPRRSRDMYFPPCVDNPEVRAFYAEAAQMLLSELDIGYLQIITNDSGAGLCWTSGLYNGANGPEACRDVPLNERLLSFLGVFQSAAERHGRELIIDMTSNIGGFKEAEAAMNAVWRELGPGQIVNGRAHDGSAPVSHGNYGLFEHVRPLRSIPLPIEFLRAYDAAMRAPSPFAEIIVRETDFDEYARIIEKYTPERTRDAAGRYALLRDVAEDIAGSDGAAALLEAWIEIDEAISRLSGLYLDNFVLMPLVSQRLINRPLAPVPQLLTDEETRYYRPYLFQAGTEERARDLMDIQGMDFIRGFCAARIATLAVRDARARLKKAIELVLSLAAPGESGDSMRLLADRLRVLDCLAVSFDNACRYQEVLDRTAPDERPPMAARWPTEADGRLLTLNAVARREIDNAYRLKALLEGRAHVFLPLADAPEHEDIFLLSRALSEQLARKAEIMLSHLRDVDAIYESNNK